MTYRHLPLVLALLIACSYGASDAAHHKANEQKGESAKQMAPKPVMIADANLRAVIADSLNKASDEVITTADLAKLKRLVAPNANISDLSGLEHATNLTYLNLGQARVENKAVNSNAVSDLSALSGLKKLRTLNLTRNNVSDISALSGLTNLRSLNLTLNRNIADISALSGLTKLRTLNLAGNKVADISAVSGMAELKTLGLNNNKVMDIAPAAGLAKLETLNIKRNALNDMSMNTHVAALKKKGVKVNMDAMESMDKEK
jgi:Leucine-rich repeat (LRR) protein